LLDHTLITTKRRSVSNKSKDAGDFMHASPTAAAGKKGYYSARVGENYQIEVGAYVPAEKGHHFGCEVFWAPASAAPASASGVHDLKNDIAAAEFLTRAWELVETLKAAKLQAYHNAQREVLRESLGPAPIAIVMEAESESVAATSSSAASTLAVPTVKKPVDVVDNSIVIVSKEAEELLLINFNQW
jgi:predicted Rossmann fold nucleotide-binding protein DprA/Smf involved in DNA uptake